MNGPDEYDQLVSRGFKDYSKPHRQVYAVIVSLLHDKPSDILEIGTGIGYGYISLFKGNCINFYQGVEPSDKCRDYVFEKYDKILLPNNWIEQDMRDHIYDFSLCIEVIEHVENIDLVAWFKKMYEHTRVASFISTPDKRTDPHGVFTKEEVQDALYKTGYNHVVKIEWQLPHTLFIAEV